MDFGGGGFFGDAGGGGGGGFVTGHNDGGGFGGTPGSASKGERGGSLQQSLTPLTVMQFNRAVQAHADDTFRVDGKEMSSVAIVGQIMKMVPNNTNLQFTVSDGTGSAEVRIWLDTDADGNTKHPVDQWREGAYVQVVGNPRSFQGKRSIVAYSIRVVEDMNAVTNHLLRCIYVHLYNIQGPIQTAGSGAVGGMGSVAVSGGTGSYSRQQFGAPGGSNAAHGGGGHVSPLQDAVLSVIQQCQAQEGAHIQHIIKSVSAHVPGCTPQQISSTIEFLSSEGHLYSTIDDEHFKSAD